MCSVRKSYLGWTENILNTSATEHYVHSWKMIYVVQSCGREDKGKTLSFGQRLWLRVTEMVKSRDLKPLDPQSPAGQADK